MTKKTTAMIAARRTRSFGDKKSARQIILRRHRKEKTNKANFIIFSRFELAPTAARAWRRRAVPRRRPGCWKNISIRLLFGMGRPRNRAWRQEQRKIGGR